MIRHEADILSFCYLVKIMKITVKQLRTIIKEEVNQIMKQSRDIAFKPGSPNIYSSPKDFSEFMERVETFGVSLEEFKGKLYDAYDLISGVYNCPQHAFTATHVQLAGAIAKGDIRKLESLVEQAPEGIERGNKWLQSQMDSLHSKD